MSMTSSLSRRRRPAPERSSPLRLVAYAVAALLFAGVGFLFSAPRASLPPPTVERRPLEGRPSAVAVVGGHVWYTDDATSAVRRVGGAEHVGVPPQPVSLAAGGVSLWVGHATGVLTRLELPSLRRTSRRVGTSITGVAYLGHHVWAADLGGARLLELDRSLQVRRSVHMSDAPVRIATGGGALWLTTEGGRLVRVDPLSGRVLETVDVGPGAIGLATDGRSVWVASSEDDAVAVFDAATVRPLGRVGVGRGPVDLAISGDTVAVADQDARTITLIDARRRRVRAALEAQTHLRAIAAGSDGVWAVGTDPSRAVHVRG